MNGPKRIRIPLLATAAAAAILGAGVTASVAAPNPATPPAEREDSAPAAAFGSAVDRNAVPEGIIVGYKKRTDGARSDTEARADARAKGAKAGERLGFDRRLGTGAALVGFDSKMAAEDVKDVMAAYASDPDVAYVVPDERVYPTATTPNDPSYTQQWDLFENHAGMRVPGAWQRGATGKGVNVSVIDTGYVPHSDLAANIVPGYDFISDPSRARDGDGRDSNPADQGDWVQRGECGTNAAGTPLPERDTNNTWHGTHVSGTIAATANNGKGITGIAHRARIQPVRVLGRCGGATSDIIDAITWSSGGTVWGAPRNQHPADVINMSLGGGHTCDLGSQLAINAAVARGTTVVVSAGNANTDAANQSPASCANVINVAASDREGNRAAYSNYGWTVDITAPGGETKPNVANGILSTLNSGTRTLGLEKYDFYQGTSMAAPHITGLAALMYEANPGITPARVEAAIKLRARPLPGLCTGGCGAGLADASATLASVS
ncbi:S8 family peptidase [Streptomyces flavofungini]|uniref:S8 family peptidase n=1 Tax=Streptomyces flavofungini TaxID=68200 RepID=UPI0034E01548